MRALFHVAPEHPFFIVGNMGKLLPILLLIVLTSLSSIASLADTAALSRLTLSDAEQMWYRQNREIKLARDQVAGADADTLTAAQRPNPQLSVNAGSIDIGHNGGPVVRRVTDDSDIVVRIDQTLERGNKRELRMRTADLRLDAAKHETANITRQGRISLLQAYYDLQLAQEQLRIAQDNARLFDDTLAAASLRLSAGDIPPSDLSRIRVDALRAGNEVRQAQNALGQAQVALAYQIGAERDAAAIAAVDPWPEAVAPSIDPDIESRPDVRAAQMRVQAAEAARDLAQSLKTRDVTLGFQVEHNGGNTPSHSVGVGMSVPLLTGYEYQGEIAHAEADLQSARDALEQIRSQAIAEISKTRSDLETALDQVRRYDDTLLAEADKSLQAAEFAYKHGALGVMDLLDARRTNKSARMDAAVARANYAKALAAWRYAGGEGEPK